jgi:putative lipoic acid-binding regulatory protein
VTATTDGKGAPPAPVLEYPLDYVFKVMGYSADDFPDHAERLVAGAAGAKARVTTVRSSAERKYQSVSVAVRLGSEEQRRAVYLALQADPRVVYYL